MDIKNPMYIVILSGGAGDDAPKYNGAFVAGAYTTLEEAQAKVREIADEWKENIGEDWKPGYCDDLDGSYKYADNYYAEDCTTAWHNGTSGNWERVEIASNDNKYGSWQNV